MEATKNGFAHYCEYEVISEEMDLVACNYCGKEPDVGA